MRINTADGASIRDYINREHAGAALTISFLIANFWLLIHDQSRTATTLLVFMPLFLISLISRELGICATLSYLILLGDIRRIVSLELGSAKFDLLLLVAPAMALWLSMPVITKLRLTSITSKWVAGLMAIMLLEIFNPKQGGLTVGIGGAFFYLVPVLWFWIGGKYGNARLVERILMNVILPLGLLAGLLGLCQTFIGFLPWEQAWIDAGATNLRLGGAFRAIGFSVSTAEYSRLLTFSAIILLVLAVSKNKYWAGLLPLPIAAIILESARGFVLRAVLGSAVVWALRRTQVRGAFRRTGVALAVLLCLVYFLAARFSDDAGNRDPKGTQALIAHQTGGLSHLLDDQHSTVGLHAMFASKGLISGLLNPLGFGLGSTTVATDKVGEGGGESTGFATEVDFADMFESLGIVGGIVYLAVCMTTLRSAFALVEVETRFVALSVMGILAANLGNWSISGEYSSSAFIWFLIGAIANQSQPQVHATLGVSEMEFVESGITESAKLVSFHE